MAGGQAGRQAGRQARLSVLAGPQQVSTAVWLFVGPGWLGLKEYMQAGVVRRAIS